MRTWLSRWRRSSDGRSGATSTRNSKISYKLLVEQTDSHHRFGASKVKMTAQQPSYDEDAAYAMESGSLLDEKFHELVSTKNSGRLKKILCIGLIMLVFAALIGTAYYFYGMEAAGSTSESNRSPQISGKPSISLSDYLENKLYAKRNNATWLSDSELAYTDATGIPLTFNIHTNKSSPRPGFDHPAVITAATQELSPDKQYLLLGRDYQKIFRHSTVARYEILDLQTNEVTNVSESHLLLAEWGPIGNALVFVQDNNIYYKANVDAAPAQVTTDGRENIYNGVCDWVYEEEVFSTKTALWFSPDGAQLAYIRFDDTPVRTMQIPIYGLPGAFQYPEEIIIPYPKTGSPNPKVQLFSVDLKTLATENKVEMYEILAPSKLRNVDHIVAVVAWANNDTLLSTWMNRVQNESYVQVCVDDKCKLLKSWVSHTGWVDFFKAPLFNADGTKFVFINSTQQSDKRSYRHLTMVSMADGTETPLTTGTFVVLENLHWDLKRNRIFYLGTQENASYTQQVYAVDVDKGKSTCLSCNVVRDGVPQTHFLASISPNGESMVLTSDGPSLPRADIVAIKSADPIKLEHLFTWEENKNLAAFLETKSAPIVQHHKIPLSNGFDAIVKLQIPPNIDLNGTQKYPMVVYVYAGPGSYAGTDRFDYSFGTYLCTNHSYIIAEINGRGSGQQSDELLHQIYRSLGTVEIEDQIETAASLPNKFPFIDAKRIAIWGWSYGGYASGMALAKDNSRVFACAASVAPVTDWTYYDTIYTERFMGLPIKQDNLIGYERSRLSTLPKSFMNKTYLLVHGSLDDNVHYQQSMALARTLELSDVPFDQITYPDEDHSLWGVRKHLYHSLDKYFAKCFA